MKSITLLLPKHKLCTYNLSILFWILISCFLLIFSMSVFTDRDTLLHLINILQLSGFIEKTRYIFTLCFISLKLLSISHLSPCYIFKEQVTFSFSIFFFFNFASVILCIKKQCIDTTQSSPSFLPPSPDVTTILNFMFIFVL